MEIGEQSLQLYPRMESYYVIFSTNIQLDGLESSVPSFHAFAEGFLFWHGPNVSQSIAYVRQ